ncbi:MAG: PspC domain-containing protein [Oscillospiraceae bacterium]|nr:PspC domain-containing protein [Oscillospiraceae bacterium]
MENKRLYKARGHRMLCGVCGGIAEYFNIDPTLVRLGAVVLAFAVGGGVLAYIIAAVIIPEPPAE